MTAAPHIAMMAAQDLPPASDADGAPEWIHLLPAGQVETFDNRGPYEIADPQSVIARSFSRRGEIEIDVNHATFRASPLGMDAPAHGWITEMEAREDGIWGRVNWTTAGRRLVAERAYRRISPVLELAAEGSRKVIGILNASLVNRQNLRGLTALNQEESEMKTLQERLAELLGNKAEDDDAIVAAVTKLHAAKSKEDDGAAVALQSTVSVIGTVFGLSDGADAADVLKAAQAAGKGDDAKTIAALQSELTALGTQFETLQEGTAKKTATGFVDEAIKAGRVGVKPMRERYIAMHMADPEGTAELIGALNASPGFGTRWRQPITGLIFYGSPPSWICSWRLQSARFPDPTWRRPNLPRLGFDLRHHRSEIAFEISILPIERRRIPIQV